MVVVGPVLRRTSFADFVVLGPPVETCEQLAGCGWHPRGFVVLAGEGSHGVQQSNHMTVMNSTSSPRLRRNTWISRKPSIERSSTSPQRAGLPRLLA
jgi:hypothetical protein